MNAKDGTNSLASGLGTILGLLVSGGSALLGRALSARDDISQKPHRVTPDFKMQMVNIDGQLLRVAHQRGVGDCLPLLLFNGIGANIELLQPLARAMPDREIITFDVPGVGRSKSTIVPYRFSGIARLAVGVLEHLGHTHCDVLGVSWGGGAAQQFARDHPERCQHLILCATSPGVVMVPSRPKVMLKMATPWRYISAEYVRRIAGDIYGGDFRHDPDLSTELHKHVRWQLGPGYFLQLAAIAGWTSIHWLHQLKMPTLVMAGADDPLVPLANAKLMHALIPNCQLKVFDCGHMFLLTRVHAAALAINKFLDRP